MNRIFSEYFTFSLQDGFFYPVHDYTISTLNREHTHDDVREGAENYSYNVELIAENTERKRGSDALFLVDDQHYVWCSRTGLESTGNVIKMSESSPMELRFTILKTVFKNILQRKFGDISNGIDTESLNSSSLSVMTPKDLVLKQKLTESEIKSYFDDVGEATVNVIHEFQNAETPNELKEIVSEYQDKKTKIYRKHTDFTPSIASQTIPSVEGKNNWMIPDDIDDGRTMVVLMHENMDYGDTQTKQLHIIISCDSKVELIETIDHEDTILETKSYESESELKSHINAFMKCTPQTVNEYK